ncbi:ABC transporter permease [Paenibacillus spongiae]|uniref:ABC transporter permease n=1 Tax=Paenibacillus spongiae TaxID=2909671 RepID=A0ABY5S775_9BACL|nr:ABC transporter permease [Paenibacillus spongiae]UVI28675.1 ABC transporter permease [Paenibacillus spongiae]
MGVDAIWSARAKAFWRDSSPYLRYMAQSGVPLVAALLFLTGASFYTSFIHRVPPDFPYTLVGTLLLLPFICWSPMRTWLSEADIVFLMPRENEMDRYIRRSFRYNLIPGVILASIVFLVFSLLYVQGPGLLPWYLMLVVVVLLKLLNAAGAWRDRRLAWTHARRGMRLLRWAVTGVCLAAWLQTAPWMAALLTAAAAALMVLLYGRLNSYRFPWLTLIREETRTKRRYMVFFSAFTDVPSESAQVSARRYLTWIIRRLTYRNENTFVYLYAHTLLRTELGGIVLRLTALGMLSGWLAAYSGLWSGWGTAGVYLLFVWLTGLQLSSLTQSHRYSVWRHVYPLPEQSRLQAVLRVDRVASLVCAAVLWLPLILLLPRQGYIAAAITGALLGVVYILWMRPGGLKRKFTADLEED